MKQLQLIYDELAEKKKELADIKRMVKDALEASKPYKELSEELRKKREKRKSIELEIKQGFSTELKKMDDLKIDIETHKQVMSDAALTRYTKGEKVEVKDKSGNVYTPLFTVKFKKEI